MREVFQIRRGPFARDGETFASIIADAKRYGWRRRGVFRTSQRQNEIGQVKEQRSFRIRRSGWPPAARDYLLCQPTTWVDHLEARSPARRRQRKNEQELFRQVVESNGIDAAMVAMLDLQSRRGLIVLPGGNNGTATE